MISLLSTHLSLSIYVLYMFIHAHTQIHKWKISSSYSPPSKDITTLVCSHHLLTCISLSHIHVDKSLDCVEFHKIDTFLCAVLLLDLFHLTVWGSSKLWYIDIIYLFHCCKISYPFSCWWACLLVHCASYYWVSFPVILPLPNFRFLSSFVRTMTTDA